MLGTGGLLMGVGTGLQAIAPSFAPFAAANIASRIGGRAPAPGR